MQLCPNPKCDTENPDTELVCRKCGGKLRGLRARHTVLSGRYRIEKVLGCGGFGAVYLVTDLQFKNAPLAVKENLDPEHEKAFRREAELLAALPRHANLPRVSDFFEYEQRWYMVMEYVDGQGSELLAPMSETEALRCFQGLLSAVHFLHSQPDAIIHRDLKPANVRIASDGTPFLIDFGIAKILRSLKDADHTTVRAWSSRYSPPEQIAGIAKSNPRMDIYALGATLYYWLTGEEPMKGHDRVDCARNRQPDMPEPRQIKPSISAATSRVVMEAMALQPAKRYADVPALARALRLSPQSAPAPGPRSNRRGVLGALAALAVVPAVYAGSQLYDLLPKGETGGDPKGPNGPINGPDGGPGPTGNPPPPGLTEHRAPVHAIAVATDGTQWASADASGRVIRRELATGKPLGEFDAGGDVASLAYTPGDGTLALTTPKDYPLLWNITRGERQLFLEAAAPGSPIALSIPAGLIAARSDSDPADVQLFDLETGEPTLRLAGKGRKIQALAFSSDGSKVVASHEGGLFTTWDRGKPKAQVCRTKGDDAIYTAAAIPGTSSPAMILARANGRVAVWDMFNSKRNQVIVKSGPPVRAIAFSRDGRLMATGQDDGKIRLYEANSWKELPAPESSSGSHTGIIWSLAFLPDGQNLVSGGEDQSVRYWSVG